VIRKVLPLLCLCMLLIGCASAPANDARPPNIVIILADDLGIGDVGAYNADGKIRTPSIDRIAAEGRRFTDAHSPSAVCTPTRYGLLTGRYCWRTRLTSGVLWNGYAPSLLETDRETVATRLREAGYATAVVGKWHLGFDWASDDGSRVTAAAHDHIDYGRPLARSFATYGFEESFIFPASLDMEPYCFVSNDNVVQAPTDRVPASAHRRQDGGGFWRAGAASPGFEHEQVLPRLVVETIAILDGHARRDDGRPLFLYVPLTAPHTPWVPTPAFRGASDCGWYGDFVTQVDHAIGQIDEALARNGMKGDTLLIVTSDNGAHWPRRDTARWGHAANMHWRGQKADIHEGGHRVPFIARWPGRIPAGTTSDALLCLTDLHATSLAAAGIDTTPARDSVDMLPALAGDEPVAPRESIVHHSLDGMFAIRRGQWKLILGRGSGGFTQPKRIEPAPGEPAGQLYDLVADPGETTNLYAERPEIVERLSAELEAIRTAPIVSRR
jgi:arylsulfatase A-like enzyme